MKTVVIDRDEVCQDERRFLAYYDPFRHFCVNSTSVKYGDGPIMGVDISDPDRPFYYIFGFFNIILIDRPSLGTKMSPYVHWLLRTMKL